MNYTEYLLPRTPEEAWELNRKKQNRVLAGNLFLRLSRRPFRGAIDLRELGLDRITETPGYYEIGASVTLHALERHEGLNALTDGLFRRAFTPIVGVQFRNSATVGGSVFPRFGFSDVVTVFASLGATVTLYKAGTVPMESFLAMPKDRDILLSVNVPRTPVRTAYTTLRSSSGGFPILNCAVAKGESGTRAVLGGCPGHFILHEPTEGISGVRFASNGLASGEYRRRVAPVLLRRAMEEVTEDHR